MSGTFGPINYIKLFFAQKLNAYYNSFGSPNIAFILLFLL